MRIWPFNKKEMQSNQDRDDLNRMLYELLNKNMPINKMVNLEDFIDGNAAPKGGVEL